MDLLSSHLSLIAFLTGITGITIAVFLFIKTKHLNRRLEALVAQSGGDSIEETLLEHYDRFKNLEQGFKKLITHHDSTATTTNQSIHNVGIIRFNPFPGEIGGDQSFSLALLDGSHSGIVVTALHSREGTRIYAKPIEKASSNYNLSREEKHAIENALHSQE